MTVSNCLLECTAKLQQIMMNYTLIILKFVEIRQMLRLRGLVGFVYNGKLLYFRSC